MSWRKVKEQISAFNSRVSTLFIFIIRLGVLGKNYAAYRIKILAALEEDSHNILSLVIFVVGTSIVTGQTIIVFDQIIPVLIYGPPTGGGFGADIDDVLNHIIRPGENVIAEVSGIAFAIVLGQVLHNLNRYMIIKRAEWAIRLMLFYLFLLMFSTLRVIVVQWVILAEFILITVFGLLLSWILIEQSWSHKPSDSHQQGFRN